VAGVGGIAAMPSLHVGLAFLFALVGWRKHPVLGILLGIFALLVFLGTVELAWHYAIDGYVAVLAVGAIWLAVGWAMRRWTDSLPRSTRPGPQ
jgi:hypothetical protein